MNLPIIPADVPTCDNTRMNDFNKCPRWYWIRHVKGLKPRGVNGALQFGSLLHSGLAVWYKTKDANKALAAIEEAPYIEVPGDYRTLGQALLTLERYLEHYGNDEQFKVILNETPFNLEDGEGFRWGGRLDLGVLWNGGVWIADHKSTSMGGPTWWYQFDYAPQIAGYCWAGSKLHGAPIRGAIINRIVVRKSGTYEFERRFFLFPDWKIREWRETRINDYHRLARAYEENEFPPNHYACHGKYGRCPAFDVCNSPPKARPRLLNEIFEEDPWDWSEE